MGGVIGRLCGVPLILRTRHVLASISSKLSYIFPHVILTCSGAIAEQMASQGVQREKLVVVSTGNDEARFRFSAENRAAIRGSYGIGEDEIVLGNVGFLRRYKGHPFILDTLARLPPQYRCLLVGGGDELVRLQEQAKRLGITERVIFAGHQEQPERFFSAFDLFFFASNEAEGISQALIQAMLNGLPVLGCSIPSTMEALRLIDAHRLAAYGDVEAAVQGIDELLQQPRRDPGSMEQQHRIIAEHYGLQPMVQRLLDTYRRFGVVPPQS